RGVAVGPLVKLGPASGAVDTAFTPPISIPFGNPPKTMLAGPGSSLYVGNASAGLGGGVFSTGLCQLDTTTGAVDIAFSQAAALKPLGTAFGATAVVSDAVVSGSSLYVAGDFEHDVGSSSSGITELMKIDAATGALDATFSQSSGPNGSVNSLFLDAGSLYVGGAFSSY